MERDPNLEYGGFGQSLVSSGDRVISDPRLVRLYTSASFHAIVLRYFQNTEIKLLHHAVLCSVSSLSTFFFFVFVLAAWELNELLRKHV